MIYGVDHAESSTGRQNARPAHLARLQVLRDAGRLLLAGPLPATKELELSAPVGASTPVGATAETVVGSLILADFASLAEAQTWAADDPYVHAGVYCQVHVHPWKAVFLPDASSMPSQP
jgi:hypothetical protein